MSGELAIALALILPLLICAGIWLVGRIPDLREGVTLVGAGALFFIAIIIAGKVSAGEAVELSLGEAVPGLEFAFRAEPLGALFALVASGLWIVNSFYSIGFRGRPVWGDGCGAIGEPLHSLRVLRDPHAFNLPTCCAQGRRKRSARCADLSDDASRHLDWLPLGGYHLDRRARGEFGFRPGWIAPAS